jgi:hypothetical protein
VVHAVIDFKSAIHEIPPILAGKLVEPKSKIGSNYGKKPEERKKPKAIVFGEAVTRGEIKVLKHASGANAPDVMWLRIDGQEIDAAGGASAKVIAPIMIRKLRDIGVEDEQEDVVQQEVAPKEVGQKVVKKDIKRFELAIRSGPIPAGK